LPKSDLEVKSILEVSPSLELKQFISPKSELEIKSVLETKSILETKQLNAQVQIFSPKQVLETKQVLEPIVDIPKPKSPETKTIIERPPFEPPKIVKSLPSKKEDVRSRMSKLLVRRRGKFEVKAIGEDIGKLTESGIGRLKSSLSASFKITDEGGKALNISTPKGFIRSKRDSNVIVQPREQRLGSRLERLEIRQARRLR